jgi:hypothetical protein
MAKLEMANNIIFEWENLLPFHCWFLEHLNKQKSLKSHREKKNVLDIFAIHTSSRHEKRCQMCVRLFCLFQCSRNQQ